MALTDAQKATLLADIGNNTATVSVGGVSTQINQIGTAGKPAKSGDSAQAVAEWYNGAASPAFTVWRKAVPLSEIAVKLNGAELGGLTTANHTRLQTVITLVSAAGGANPSVADQRAFWDDIFSGAGGATTRANLLALWKKLATFLQKLFSTGTGSDASPATLAANLGENEKVTGDEIRAAWGV